MNRQKRQLAGIGAAVIAVLTGLVLFFNWGAPQLAAATCDRAALQHFATTAAKTDNVDKRDEMQKAIARCMDLDKFTGSGDGGSSATPTTTTSKVPLPEGKRHVEFLANRPAIEKVAYNAHGPKIALAESNESKPMGELTASEAHEEHLYRLSIDPMQTSTGECGTTPIPCKEGEIDEKTKLYASNWDAWDKAKALLLERLSKMQKSVRTIVAGTPVPMQYSMPGDIPLVVYDDNVVFGYDIKVIDYKDGDGNVYSARLECGFQWLKATGRPMPKAAKGFTRTPEGTPVVEKPPSSTTETPPVTTTTHETTSTPPVTTTTSTYTCPNGGEPPACSKTSASQPPKVTSPSQPPGTLQPTSPTQTSPLQPTPPAEPTRTSVPPVEETSTTHSGVPPRPSA